MPKAEISFKNYGHGKESSICIDGVELSSHAHDVTISLRCGELANIDVGMYLTSCDITAEGEVIFNGTPVSYEIGKRIYEQLKEYYEPESKNDGSCRYKSVDEGLDDLWT